MHLGYEVWIPDLTALSHNPLKFLLTDFMKHLYTQGVNFEHGWTAKKILSSSLYISPILTFFMSSFVMLVDRKNSVL